ncbi:protein kinase family protein [Striga asiatica]|uniref:Protein kinase family protein n=1 Tax=Striga asiatica TaxID=4170 RepID=A0A5A7QXF3_STRAF|nr:protein kinase family protein [Striga asiatica]
MDTNGNGEEFINETKESFGYNKSFDKYIFGSVDRLDFKTSYRIAVRVAKECNEMSCGAHNLLVNPLHQEEGDIVVLINDVPALLWCHVEEQYHNLAVSTTSYVADFQPN